MDLNTVVIIILIVYFFICVLKKISFKIAFVTSMIFIVVAVGALMFDNEYLANNIATIGYYLLIVAVALAVVEYFRDFTKTKKVKKPKEILPHRDTNKSKKK